jgi:signal peptidase II
VSGTAEAETLVSEPDPTPAPDSGAAVTESPASEAPDSEEREAPSYLFFGIVAFVSAVLDLGSKEWATHALTAYDQTKEAQRTIVVIPNLFDFQYAQNPGGAWSMLRSLPEIYRRPFFLFVSTAASVFITSVYGKIDRRDWAMKWGLPLALGGAIGNLVDRIRHGYVVDFLHFFIERPGRDFHWPTFNVADIWIVVGVVLMGLTLFFGKRYRDPEPQRPSAAGERTGATEKAESDGAGPANVA